MGLGQFVVQCVTLCSGFGQCDILILISQSLIVDVLTEDVYI